MFTQSGRQQLQAGALEEAQLAVHRQRAAEALAEEDRKAAAAAGAPGSTPTDAKKDK
jgi:hypothetical protein